MNNPTTFIASPYREAETMAHVMAQLRERSIRIVARADVITRAASEIGPVRHEKVLLLADPAIRHSGFLASAPVPVLRVSVFSDRFEQCWIAYSQLRSSLSDAEPSGRPSRTKLGTLFSFPDDNSAVALTPGFTGVRS